MEKDTVQMVQKIRSYDYLRSRMPIRSWQNTLDAMQAFLELWWWDQEILMKFFPQVTTIQEQQKQYTKNLNSIGYLLREIKKDLSKKHDEDMALRQAVLNILNESGVELQNLDPANEDGKSLADLVNDLIYRGILPTDDDTLRKQIVTHFLHCG